MPKIDEMAMAMAIMARVTLTVFGTLCGLRPLCRAYVYQRKEADAKFDSAFSEFGCLDVVV